MTDTLLPGLAALRLPLPRCLPPAWRERLAGKTVEIKIPEAVRIRLRRPAPLTPSQWSVAKRRMPAADAHPGPYRVEFARYASQVMDTWAQPWVREVWFCGVDQASKTNTMLSCIGWSIEHAPGNVFYQMPDQESSDRIMGKKLIPMLRGSLSRHMSPRADDTSLGGVTLTNGVSLIPSWAGSPTSTATFSARYTFSDEVDKMRTVGKEADPIDRIRKRTRTNRFGKNFFASTPAGGWIYRGAMGCSQVWAAAARCPGCGELVVMDEEHLVLPQGATVESLKADPSGVEYACHACGLLWGEAERLKAYERGGWVCVKGQHERRPADVGFVLSAFPLPDVPLAQIAQVVLRARSGDLSARRDLAHGIKAVDYVDVVVRKNPEEEELLRFRDPGLPPMTVPRWADFLVAFVDMQQVGFWFSVYAAEKKTFGGKKALIHYGRLSTWEDVRGLCFDARYPVQGGGELGIWRAGLDTGGGKSEQGEWSRTTEAYQWLRAHGRARVFGTKGHERREGQPKVRISVQDRTPRQGSVRAKAARRGLVLWLIDSPRFKDDLASELAPRLYCTRIGCGEEVDRWAVLERGGLCPACGGELHGAEPTLVLHSGTGIDWAKQILAEERHLQKDGAEEWTQVRKDNHYLDCAVGALALLAPEAGGVVRAPRRARPPEPPEAPTPQVPSDLAGVPEPKPLAPVRRSGGFVSGWRK